MSLKLKLEVLEQQGIPQKEAIERVLTEADKKIQRMDIMLAKAFDILSPQQVQEIMECNDYSQIKKPKV